MAKKKLKVNVTLKDMESGESWVSESEIETDQPISFIKQDRWMELSAAGLVQTACKSLYSNIKNGDS